MNYLEEQTYGEAMINSIQNGDQLLPVISQVSLAGNAQNAPPTLKDPKFWIAGEKKTQKIDRLARFLLIQGLQNDIYSLIDSNETAKDLWDALERQMRGFKYGEQDIKATILYEYETFKANEGEQLLDTYLRYEDYMSFLCGINGSAPVVLNYTGANCEASMVNGADLNLPSITLAKLNQSRTIQRTLTNVGGNESYSVGWNAPYGVSMK
nr:subtilisin-like protease SBT2.3 [Tanacetum cinerariifolium]